VWEEPPAGPAPNRRRGKYDELGAALRDQPGRQARMGTWRTKSSAMQTASQVRTGKIPALEGCEVEHRQVGEEEFGVWVRFPKTSE